MARWIRTLAAVGATLTPGSSCSSVHSGAAPGSGAAPDNLVACAPRATKDLPQLTWNLFYEPLSIDPAYSASYSENEIIANLCDSLLRLNPNFSIPPSLATPADPTPASWVYNIRKGVRFWDGKPLTAAGVTYSLRRNIDPKAVSYFTGYHRNVSKITQTGPCQVTVTLKRPDALFNEAMATAAGAVIEKACAQKEGGALGSPHGGIMCSGPFRFFAWDAGDDLIIAQRPLLGSGTPGASRKGDLQVQQRPSTQAEGLLTGQVQGMHQGAATIFESASRQCRWSGAGRHGRIPAGRARCD